MVWVVGQDGTAQPRPLQLGEATPAGFIVENGLKPGDQVIVDNLIKLRPGAKVVPQAAKPAASAPANG